eukprot:TRINITY_DN13358_c0_g3_i2.p1 TRINITY_DN13358_c0_g3~~TRINITY_DN13358_c0_g3_i2.p1  ORF type:complete len:334 (+),score=64.52 TRINITY_DN13358_c0_g3_i2:83-1084(+)
MCIRDRDYSSERVDHIKETNKELGEKKETEASDMELDESKRKHIPYSANLSTLILKFLFFILFMECYFVAIFILCLWLTSNSNNMTSELDHIIGQALSVKLTYWSFQEYIGTKGMANVYGMNSEAYLLNRLDNMLIHFENFLSGHNDHSGSYHRKYNDLFQQLVYGDICEGLFAEGKERGNCNLFPVLNKGLNSVLVSYWEDMRGKADHFYGLTPQERTHDVIRRILNDDSVKESEELVNGYLMKVYELMVSQMNNDINELFGKGFLILLVCFIIFLLCLMFLYFVLWSLFMKSTRNSLWVMKCVTGVIPVKIMMSVQSIKNFVSKTMERLSN